MLSWHKQNVLEAQTQLNLLNQMDAARSDEIKVTESQREKCQKKKKKKNLIKSSQKRQKIDFKFKIIFIFTFTLVKHWHFMACKSPNKMI